MCKSCQQQTIFQLYILHLVHKKKECWTFERTNCTYNNFQKITEEDTHKKKVQIYSD